MNENRYAPPTARLDDPATPATAPAVAAALKLASRLLWVSLAIGLVNGALQWTSLALGAPTNNMLGVLIFVFGLIGVLTYSIGRGRNWARIVFLVLAIIGLPSLVQMPALFARAPVSAALSLLQTAIQLTAIYMVFFTSARHAFSRQKHVDSSR
jgi:hypothetical protein